MQRLRIIDTGEWLPFLALRHAHLALKRIHLGAGHQSGMIVLVAGKGRPPPLDRIGKKCGRAVVIDGIESIGKRLHAMPAEIVHEL